MNLNSGDESRERHDAYDDQYSDNMTEWSGAGLAQSLKLRTSSAFAAAACSTRFLNVDPSKTASCNVAIPQKTKDH
ncbi:MAG: hypothetical protein U0936_06475 [Planctomycetaceae bacterium]